MISLEQWYAYINNLADVYEKNEQYLTELDAAIGDADHGANMHRGFMAVKKNLSESKPDTVRAVLRLVATDLIRNVGGASGPLYGSFFLKASDACSNEKQTDAAALCALIAAGVQGIAALGKAAVGDKTMMDAWIPALECLRSTEEGSLCEKLAAACEAAEDGMKSTVPLIAKKGRASYLGERSVGHQDPGATSTYLLLKAMQETWC